VALVFVVNHCPGLNAPYVFMLVPMLCEKRGENETITIAICAAFTKGDRVSQGQNAKFHILSNCFRRMKLVMLERTYDDELINRTGV